MHSRERGQRMRFHWTGDQWRVTLPPFSVIRDCLSKIRRERASIVVVTQLWTSQSWFMVPVAAGRLLRCPANCPPVRESPSISTGRAESVMRGGQLPPRRMDVIRGRFEGEGFSSEVVDWFMAATRDNTNSAYDSAWRIWSDWCVGRGADPLCNEWCNCDNILPSRPGQVLSV
jgi:hypothetical protein